MRTEGSIKGSLRTNAVNSFHCFLGSLELKLSDIIVDWKNDLPPL